MRLTPPPCRGTRRRHTGLTLIELIVAIAVLTMIATIGVPSFQRFTARNEVTAEVMRIRMALSTARSSAITLGHIISLCPITSINSSECDQNNWSLPIAILNGKASGGNLNGLKIIKVLEPSASATTTFNRQHPIRFQENGWSRGHNGTFTICGRDNQGAKVILSNSGRVRKGAKNPDC